MDRRKRASYGIAKQYRHTIRRLHGGQDMMRVADDHIAVDRFAELALRRLRFVSVRNDANIRAMNLPTTRKGPLARKKLEKAATILQNVLRSIVVESREAQRVGRHVADAAEPGGKAVNKSIFFESSTNKNANSVELAPEKSRFG